MVVELRKYPCPVCGANPHLGSHFISKIGRVAGRYNKYHIEV